MDVNKVEGLQRRFTKSLNGLYNMEYKERLEICKLQNLNERRSRGDIIEIFKMLSGRYNINTEDVIELDKGKVLRGNNKKLKRKKFKGDLRGSYFSIRAVRKWNELDRTIVNSRDLNEFKKEIDGCMANAETNIQ